MLNDSGIYDPNEVPHDIITPTNKSHSIPSSFGHNLENYVKIMQEAASTSNGPYDLQNVIKFEQSPSNLQSQIHPLEMYQSVGYLSSYMPSHSSLSPDNATTEHSPAVSRPRQEDVQDLHLNNVLSSHQNTHFKTSFVHEASSRNESSVIKNYPLNIPHLPTRIFQKTCNVRNNIKNFNLNTQFSPITSTAGSITSDLDDTKIPPYNISEVIPGGHKDRELNIPENLSQNLSQNSTNISDENKYNPTDQSLALVSENNSINSSPTTKLSKRKRESLEKTVRLIESILIKSTNNNPNPDNAETSVSDTDFDPLAVSPKPPPSHNSNSVSEENSDNEALTKFAKRKPRKTRSPSKKIQSERRSHVVEYETNTQYDMRMKSESQDIVIKIEKTSSPDRSYVNPFLRDYNGVQMSEIGDVNLVSMENSVEEASKAKSIGANSTTYYECPYCSLLLRHPKRFLIHTKWHTFGLINEKRAEMAKERERIVQERRQARVIQRLEGTKASGAEDDEMSLHCKDCDKVFTTKGRLRRHRSKFHLSQMQQCLVCLVEVQGTKALRAHMAEHEDKTSGDHQCPHCSKRFKHRHSLFKHSGVHLEKKHSCPECSKMFGSELLVKLHMKTHERAARGTTYHCSYCGKGFYEPYNLNVHERTHRNDKPYKCDTCGSCFVTNSSLKRHIKVSHSAGVSKPHTCGVCQKCFATGPIRDRHEVRAHSDPEQFPHRCQLCPKRYMKPKDLRAHVYKAHETEKKKTSSTEDNIMYITPDFTI